MSLYHHIWKSKESGVEVFYGLVIHQADTYEEILWMGEAMSFEGIKHKLISVLKIGTLFKKPKTIEKTIDYNCLTCPHKSNKSKCNCKRQENTDVWESDDIEIELN